MSGLVVSILPENPRELRSRFSVRLESVTEIHISLEVGDIGELIPSFGKSHFRSFRGDPDAMKLNIPVVHYGERGGENSTRNLRSQRSRPGMSMSFRQLW